MNVYAETNFILELVFLQEQFQSCALILQLAEDKKIKLILPSYSLIEPFEKLHRQRFKRQQIQQELNLEIRSLSRAQKYESQIKSIDDLSTLLSQSVEEERKRFETYRNCLLKICSIIPLDADTLSEASNYEGEYSFSGQDAVVFSSILKVLKNNSDKQSCFLNRNSKDFDIPEVKGELLKFNCQMIPSFDDGLNYINSRLQSAS